MSGDDQHGCSLDCPVCMEAYNTDNHLPKMMSCLHTTCADCIVNMTRVKATNTENAPQPAGTQTEERVEPSREATLTPDQFFADLRASLMLRQTRPTVVTQRRVALPSRSVPSTVRYTVASPLERPGVFRSLGASVASPKPVVKTQTSRLVKEIPKNVEFFCPICRAKINTNNVQTNRYIIAHLEDLERLKNAKPQIPAELKPEPPAVFPRQVRTSNIQKIDAIKSDWCEECHALATVNKCTNHERIPLAEWNESQSVKLRERTLQMEKKADMQKENLLVLEGELRTILATTGTLLSKVESQRKEWSRIKVLLQQLKSDCDPTALKTPGKPPIGMLPETDATVRARRETALKIQELTKLLYVIKDESAKMENDGVVDGDCIVWQGDNKLYMKNGNKTFSIVREDADYVS
ncbi:uncharacterized protein LOC108671504 [Hyalella azteca]|uniref:Uncharacterized protein LOC108671504 n=1 Tax=Hyalella azteca TaxID=294128 RepID=A0A8B7NMX4_HYAAZ|nr:uncharacterized protein LOC108671504 [Hyalella azteca]